MAPSKVASGGSASICGLGARVVLLEKRFGGSFTRCISSLFVGPFLDRYLSVIQDMCL